MSDQLAAASSLQYSKTGKDTGDHYDYPNIDTYRGSLRGNGTTLSKGAIFGLGVSTVNVSQSPTSGTPGGPVPVVTRQVLTQYYKKFQFNPVTLQMNTQFVPVESKAAEQNGGGATNVTGLGSMTTAIELMFMRETETFRATNGNLGGGRMNAQSAAVYKRIGVMKDIYDLYRVILANGDDQPNGSKDIALPDDMTLSALSGRAFDLATAGSLLFGRAIGLFFNPDMIVYGNVTGLSIVFKKWNSNYVPTVATANLSMEAVSARPSTAATSTSAPTTTATTASGATPVGAPIGAYVPINADVTPASSWLP